MKGKLYSVGVGPGDPELMTLKAVRLIKECDVLAIPQGDSDVLVAKNIVEGIVDLSKKEQLLVYMPMVKDHDIISKPIRKARMILLSIWTRARTWCLLRWDAPPFTLPVSTYTNWC